jgi:hypothetical protein
MNYGSSIRRVSYSVQESYRCLSTKATHPAKTPQRLPGEGNRVPKGNWSCIGPAERAGLPATTRPYH